MDARKISRAAEKKTREFKEEYLRDQEEAERLTHELKKTQAKLAEAFKQFSALQLNSNIGRFQEASRTMVAREQSIADMKRRLEDTERSISKVLSSLEEKTVRFEAIADIVEAESNDNPSYREWQVAAQELELVRQSDEEIQSEVTAKLKGFTNDQTFAHLLKLGFGTPSYQQKIWLTWAHQVMAKACSFSQNLKTYQMLRTLSNASASKLDSYRSKVSSLHVEAARHREFVEHRHGLQFATDEIDSSETLLKDLKEKARSILSEIRLAHRNEDANFKKSQKLIENEIMSMPIQKIKELALATESQIDDHLVKEIEGLRAHINTLYYQIESTKEKVASKQTIYEAAKQAEKRVANKLRSSSSYSYRGLDIDSLITGYALGTITSIAIDSAIERAERYTPTPSSSSFDIGGFGGGGFSSSSSSGGGFGGGGFSSSSSSGGGSFSTSDSF